MHVPVKEQKALPEVLRPTKEQKNRSSILALAFSAKMNEEELEEKWAQGRKLRREARGKYGIL